MQAHIDVHGPGAAAVRRRNTLTDGTPQLHVQGRGAVSAALTRMALRVHL